VTPLKVIQGEPISFLLKVTPLKVIQGEPISFLLNLEKSPTFCNSALQQRLYRVSILKESRVVYYGLKIFVQMY